MEGTTKPGRGFVVLFYRERCCTGGKIVLRVQKKSNIYYLYFLGDDTYCYYKEKQHFADGEYYICGKTAVSQQNITNMINGVGNDEKN